MISPARQDRLPLIYELFQRGWTVGAIAQRFHLGEAMIRLDLRARAAQLGIALPAPPSLAERNRRIYVLRTEGHWSLRQIARAEGLSVERVRQIVEKVTRQHATEARWTVRRPPRVTGDRPVES